MKAPVKATRKSTPRRRWTETDDAFVRSTMGQPIKAVAKYLDRSYQSISHRRVLLASQDTAQKFVHVPDPVDEALEAVAADLQKVWKQPLTPKQQDAKLKTFHLYEGIYPEADEPDEPSLMQRLGAWIKRVMRRA